MNDSEMFQGRRSDRGSEEIVREQALFVDNGGIDNSHLTTHNYTHEVPQPLQPDQLQQQHRQLLEAAGTPLATQARVPPRGNSAIASSGNNGSSGRNAVTKSVFIYTPPSYPNPYGKKSHTAAFPNPRVYDHNGMVVEEEGLDPDTEQLLKGRGDVEAPVVVEEPIAYRDRSFALLFLAHLVFILFLACAAGFPNISQFNLTGHSDKDSDHSQGTTLLIAFTATAAIGSALSVVWLHVLQNYVTLIIKGTLMGGVLAFLVAAAVSFAQTGTSGVLLGFGFLLCALFSGLYYRTIASRIPFTATNLVVASNVIRKFPLLVYTAYLALLVQFVWILIWGAAMVGMWALAAGNLHGSSVYANMVVFSMMISLFWGLQVVKNIVHCIAAGTVGDWWYNVAPHNAVENAAKRALSTSFGSICLGSLVVAILNTIRTLFAAVRQKKKMRHLNACLECLVRNVERGVQYFNRYAYCQVALYGKDFRSAGYDTMTLFRERGWTLIANDFMIASVLGVGCLVVGATTGLIGAGWIYGTVNCSSAELIQHANECDTLSVMVITFTTCMFIGFSMCALVSSIIESVVATMLVCFAQDPSTLQLTNPEEFNRIVGAWQQFHPETIAASGPAYAVLRV